MFLHTVRSISREYPCPLLYVLYIFYILTTWEEQSLHFLKTQLSFFNQWRSYSRLVQLSRPLSYWRFPTINVSSMIVWGVQSNDSMQPNHINIRLSAWPSLKTNVTLLTASTFDWIPWQYLLTARIYKSRWTDIISDYVEK